MAWVNQLSCGAKNATQFVLLFNGATKAPHLFIFQVLVKHLFDPSCNYSEIRETDNSAALAIVVITNVLAIVCLSCVAEESLCLWRI